MNLLVESPAAEASDRLHSSHRNRSNYETLVVETDFGMGWVVEPRVGFADRLVAILGLAEEHHADLVGSGLCLGSAVPCLLASCRLWSVHQ